MEHTAMYSKARELMLAGDLTLDACTWRDAGAIIQVMCGSVPVLWVRKDLWEECKAGKNTIWIFDSRHDITARLMALQKYRGPNEIHND